MYIYIYIYIYIKMLIQRKIRENIIHRSAPDFQRYVPWYPVFMEYIFLQISFILKPLKSIIWQLKSIHLPQI